jgi:DNA-binding NarL/FixJ family response regulator
VHLTRLEHRPGSDGPEPASDALADARRRLTALTTKQRGLLHVLEAEGGVAAAAARLGTSSGNVYAGLRRIVHRLGLRDTGELLRFVGSGELLRAARS